MNENLDTAVFAAGCFWCYEPIYKSVKGIVYVTPGYTGGNTENPEYLEVAEGQTGHAESFIIEFDPNIITYNDLLDVFWHVHDPTSLNKQGNDEGTQYRSAIFYKDEDQKRLAEESKIKVQEEFDKPIVTEISKLGEFYEAEDYHKNYYKSHPNNPYCQIVISPKIKKFQEKYKNLLKE